MGIKSQVEKAQPRISMESLELSQDDYDLLRMCIQFTANHKAREPSDESLVAVGQCVNLLTKLDAAWVHA